MQSYKNLAPPTLNHHAFPNYLKIHTFYSQTKVFSRQLRELKTLAAFRGCIDYLFSLRQEHNNEESIEITANHLHRTRVRIFRRG